MNDPRSAISDVIDSFEENQCPYELVMPDAEEYGRISRWIEETYQVSFSRIDRKMFPDGDWREWSEWEEVIGRFMDLTKEHGLMEHSVEISWSDKNKPSLKATMECVVKNCEAVLGEDWDVWITSMANGWCIQKSDNKTIGYIKIDEP